MLKQSLKVSGTLMATTLALAVTAQNAKALDFNFSLDFGGGDFLSGTITGLENNTANQAADSLIITSFPDPAATNPPQFSEGNDAVQWTTVTSNDFTVSNGLLTNLNFSASSPSTDQFSIIPNGAIANIFDVSSRLNAIDTEVLFPNSSSVFTPATPVPFGVLPDTGLGILAGIWGISRLRKTMRGRKSLNK